MIEMVENNAFTAIALALLDIKLSSVRAKIAATFLTTNDAALTFLSNGNVRLYLEQSDQLL